MWKNNVKVNILVMKKNIICVYLSDHENNFWMSCVYGHPELHKRYRVWNDIVNFAFSINNNDEWITIGDFNQVISYDDKISFRNNDIRGVDQLKDCLNFYKLSELPHKG